MSLLFLEGFDEYTTAQLGYKYNPQAGTVNQSSGRFGGNSFSPSGPTAKSIAPSGGLVFGFAMINPTGLMLTLSTSTPTTLMSVFFDTSTNIISVRDATNTAIVSSPGNAVNPTLWTYVEIKIAGWGAGQLVTMHLAGLPIASGIGNTSAGGVPPAAYAWQSGAGTVDDNYWLDTSGTSCNDFAGEARVDTSSVVSNGRVNQLTGVNAGLQGNYTCVNDIAPDGDATYVTSGAVGTTGCFAVRTPPVPYVSVLGVQVNAAVRRDSVGPINVKLGVGNGTAEIYGPAQPASTSYIYVGQVSSINPLTNVPWTPTDINNLQLAIQVA